QGLGWTAGDTVPFFTLPVTAPDGRCLTLELTDDTFQQTENLDWFISLNGTEVTDGYAGGTVSAFTFHPITNQTTGNGYCTIQAAINAATAGDVILIGPGVYVENLQLNKSITLQGTSGGTTMNPSTACGGDGIVITANGAIVNGMDFEGFQRAVVAQADGIQLIDVGGLMSCGTGLELANGTDGLSVQDSRFNNDHSINATSAGIRAGTDRKSTR